MTSVTTAAATQALSARSAQRLSEGLPEGKNSDGEGLRVAAEGFEELLLLQLLKTMRQSIPYADEGGPDFARSTIDGMFDEAVAQATAGSLNIAPMLARQLAPSTPPPTTTLGATYRELSIPALSTPPAPLEVVHASRNGSGPPRARESVGTFSGAIPRPGDMPLEGRRSSPYGWRTHPISGDRKFHGGIDLAAPEGSEIRAVAPGVVTFAGRRPGYGKTVEVRHRDGALSRYAHASRVHVAVGDRIEAGEALADVGSTGAATGPHLHLEIRRNGRTVDPDRYLEKLRRQHDSAASSRRTGVLTTRR